MPGSGRLFPSVPSSARAVIAALTVPGSSDLVYQIGDNVNSTFIVTHSLNSRFYIAQVYASAAPFDTVEVDMRRPDLNSLVLDFGTYIPAAGEFTLVVVPRGVVPVVNPTAATQEFVNAALEQIATPAANTQLVYNSSGQLIQVIENRTDSTVNITTLTYNAGGQLTKVVETNPPRTTNLNYTTGVLSSVTVA